MRFSLPKFLVLPCMAMLWLSCDQELNSAKDQPAVDYVLIVTDSATSLPMDSVRIRVTTITGDTSSYLTSAEEGRVQLPTLFSSRTLFEMSRSGYSSRDCVDTVNTPIDTVFHRPVTRLIRLRLVRVGPSFSYRPQLILLPRDANFEKLKKSTVVFEDSTGTRQSISDTAASGSIGLRGLKVGKDMVLLNQPGFLGHWFEVTVDKVPDTATIPSAVVTLVSLGDNRITGQVFYATGSGAKPLLGAKVEFRLKDSLAVPETFTTFTSSKPEEFGRFELDSVPALDGQILYYKDRTSKEALKSIPILKEEVAQDGPLPPQTLIISSDSSMPYLVEGPKDTINTNDSLLFRFNQKVDAVAGYSIRLINQSELLVDTAWNKDRTLLKIWQRDAKWVRGKKYEYELSLRNAAGQYFTQQGDSQTVLKGIFSVPDSSAGADTTLLLPKNIDFAYFNSGAYHLFSQADSNSSPKPDSSSQFALLKWNWSSGAGHKVDSLLLYYKDGGISADNWTLWGSVPGFLDSATLNFSDHYSTSRDANQKPPLPFKTAGGKIFFRIIPKQSSTSLPDTILDGLEQGMGPTVYAALSKGSDTLATGPNSTDSLKVEFFKVDKDPSSVFDWGASRPIPTLYVNGIKDSTIATWKWVNGTTGRLIYKLPPLLTSATRIHVDLNGVLFQGKPIWQRNRKNEFVLP